jgi:predicted RNA-binding Zn-ribbon protein involved in translation (DUF1610 family)
MPSEPHCPHCGSRSIKKSSAIYQQGQSTYSGSSTGLGIGSNGKVGIYGGQHTGRRITKIAEDNAPPMIDANNMACLLVLAPIGLVFLGFIANGFIGMMVCGLISVIVVPIIAILSATLSPKSEAQATADEAYLKQWYCSKCGEKFQL